MCSVASSYFLHKLLPATETKMMDICFGQLIHHECLIWNRCATSSPVSLSFSLSRVCHESRVKENNLPSRCFLIIRLTWWHHPWPFQDYFSSFAILWLESTMRIIDVERPRFSSQFRPAGRCHCWRWLSMGNRMPNYRKIGGLIKECISEQIKPTLSLLIFHFLLSSSKDHVGRPTTKQCFFSRQLKHIVSTVCCWRNYTRVRFNLGKRDGLGEHIFDMSDISPRIGIILN